MRILMVSAEAYPLASTGGLAGVVGSLPAALAGAGHRVAVAMPFYGGIELPGEPELLPGSFRTSMGEEFGVARTFLPGTDCPVFLVSRGPLFDRDGLYGPRPGEDWPDNSLRFAFFCRSVLPLLERAFPADVVHCHDWHAGLVPAYLRHSSTATVTTIHNLAFQGRFPHSEYHVTGLSPELYTPEGIELWGSFSFLKAGIVWADMVTTVSPTYAEEIQTPGMGHGLDGVLRSRSDSLEGVLNGIDYESWDPSSDPVLEAEYSAESLAERRRCAGWLRREMGIGDGVDVLAGMVGRLTSQKGVDLVLEAAPRLMDEGVGLVVLGTGRRELEEGMRDLEERFPGRVAIRIDYDDILARRIFAGSDLFLMPSRFEPCGLGQMMAMRYGAVPVVRATGGLADTVTDLGDDPRGNGFSFGPASAPALESAVLRAAEVRRSRRWPWLVKRCMRQDSSWSGRSGAYVDIYRRALGGRGC